MVGNEAESINDEGKLNGAKKITSYTILSAKRGTSAKLSGEQSCQLLYLVLINQILVKPCPLQTLHVGGLEHSWACLCPKIPNTS